MAKKQATSPALEFEFSAAELKGLLAKNPDKVLFTVSVEAVTTKAEEKVGALRISAKGVSKGKAKGSSRDAAADGTPKPPGWTL
jgi:hypothetical protein